MAVIISGDTGIDKITDGSVVNADLATGIDAAKLTGTLPAIDGSALTNLPASGPVIKYVTDSTDISVTNAANVGQHNIGSTFSVDIPTSGSFQLKQVVIRLRNDATDYASPTMGLRIGSTNYWFGVEESTADGLEIIPFTISHNNTLNDISTFYSGSGSSLLVNGTTRGSRPIRDIVESGIPTGTQTVQLVIAKPDLGSAIAYGTGNYTVLGTSLTTRVAIEFTEYS